MERPLHHRAFVVSAVWTLILLFLGSVVHATESSLACPDWPTCYGTMLPEMSGGIFWEHLHRLVAGGLFLMWLLAAWLARGPARERPWIRRAVVAGIVVLVVQSVLGGVTVILELPDAVSTAHLGLAFLFLALATVLAAATAPEWGDRDGPGPSVRRSLRPWTLAVGGLVFLQSLLGAWVRHADAGLACPGVPLCLGEWVPPLDQLPIALHFLHRAVGVVVAAAVGVTAGIVLRRTDASRLRRAALGAVALVLLQVGLGFLSVTSFLAVTPVSLHTLVAATLLAVVAAMATWTWEESVGGTVREPAAAATAPAPRKAREGG